MEIFLADDASVYRDGLLKLLSDADCEFVPPLSKRSSTTQGVLDECAQGGIMLYLDGVLKQRLLVATEGESLIGFVSFKTDYFAKDVGLFGDIYISTVIVAPEGRGRQLTKRMYRYLADAFVGKSILTRTWSTNYAHSKILADVGFLPVKVLKNHRANGIDTVYYLK